MSYELIDSEKLNKLILSIETLNEQVKKLSNKSGYEKKKIYTNSEIRELLGVQINTKVPRRWQIGIS